MGLSTPITSCDLLVLASAAVLGFVIALFSHRNAA